MNAISSEQAIKDALSHPRIATFEAATTTLPALTGALALYAWNAQVSGAMLAPLHICEVVIRNAVSEALTTVYGPDWPWDPSFVGSLPRTGRFSMRNHLTLVRQEKGSTGKLIPELAFAFWQKMFTGRFDMRIWNVNLIRVMPNLQNSWSPQVARKRIYDDLEIIRGIRNRIAHHEPIFSRPLAAEFQRIEELIAFRCPVTAAWMVRNQQVQDLIAQQPA